MLTITGKGRLTIWTLGLAKYIHSITKKKGDHVADAFRTAGFLAFTGGLIAPQLYYRLIGTYVAPIAGGFVYGFVGGVAATSLLIHEAEQVGLVEEGTMENYLEVHTNPEQAWEEIYSPTAIKDNFLTIWNHYF